MLFVSITTIIGYLAAFVSVFWVNKNGGEEKLTEKTVESAESRTHTLSLPLASIEDNYARYTKDGEPIPPFTHTNLTHKKSPGCRGS